MGERERCSAAESVHQPGVRSSRLRQASSLGSYLTPGFNVATLPSRLNSSLLGLEYVRLFSCTSVRKENLQCFLSLLIG
jgi:hypothetical protein